MKAAALAALLLAFATTAGATDIATASDLHAGDTLTYAVTLELQQHSARKGGQQEATSAASGQGQEVIRVYGIAADGTAFAHIEAQFNGSQDGQPIQLHGNFLGKVMPDGEIRIQGGINPSIDEALNFANQITREAIDHGMAIGRTWTTSSSTPLISMTINRRVTARQRYQTFPVWVIESTANGVLKKTADGKPAEGSVTIAGTSYYDDRERLLIGESLRMLTVMQPPQDAATHVSYSASINFVLSELSRASSTTPEPTPAQVEGGQSPTPSASAAPPTSPSLPGSNGATPAATVTPRSSS